MGRPATPTAAKLIEASRSRLYQEATPTQMLKKATDAEASRAFVLTVSVQAKPSMNAAPARIGTPPIMICQAISR